MAEYGVAESFFGDDVDCRIMFWRFIYGEWGRVRGRVERESFYNRETDDSTQATIKQQKRDFATSSLYATDRDNTKRNSLLM